MNRSATFSTFVKRTTAAVVFAATTFAGIGITATTADAATHHSVRVCGVNNGRPETGAVVTSWYHTRSGWKQFAQAATNARGCAWVSAPRGHWTAYRIHRAPALGINAHPMVQCDALGYTTYDEGWSDTVRIPQHTDGYNLGNVQVYMRGVPCRP